MSASEFERRRLRVYVAGPISTGNLFENVTRAVGVGRRMVIDGLAPYIPHLDAFMLGGDAISWNAYLEWDLEWVAQAEAVYRVSGPSRGADLEVKHALALGLPVFYAAIPGDYDRLLRFARVRLLDGIRR